MAVLEIITLGYEGLLLLSYPLSGNTGICHDNAVAESFLRLLKRERVKRRLYLTRDEARAYVFDYIGMFYDNRRRHGYHDGLSAVQYEQ